MASILSASDIGTRSTWIVLCPSVTVELVGGALLMISSNLARVASFSASLSSVLGASGFSGSSAVGRSSFLPPPNLPRKPLSFSGITRRVSPSRINWERRMGGADR